MLKPIKITHLITGLCTGGAEMMLFRLLSRTDRARFEPDVISMMGVGTTGEMIRELGIPVRALALSRSRPNPFGIFRLVKWLRQTRPDVLATWMYHANFAGSLAAAIAGRMPVVWGIHHGHLDSTLERRRTVWVAHACAPMSYSMAAAVICCSECSRQEHIQMGYDPQKMVVIRNGFDLSIFRPDRSQRPAIRRELNIADDAPVLFLAGRFHPQKDHRAFVQAAALLHRRLPQARFVLCGHEIGWDNQALVNWIDEAGMRDSFRLLGRRADVAALLNACDLGCSSSVCGEAFSLAIGEAMSCGLPCVVTDIGDSGFLLGDAGIAVPPSDPQAFAAACEKVLLLPETERRELGERARHRIEDNFELSYVTGLYEHLYEAVVEQQARTKKPLARKEATV